VKFKDYFSAQSSEYVKFRPTYPQELFEFLTSQTKEHKTAWDCACGSGQAAVGLAEFYDKVIATDASLKQIENAISHPKVTYIAAPAENSGLETHSADLITVATAIHWIDTSRFYPEVKRILKPGGIIAVWNYAHSKVSPDIDRVFNFFANKTLLDYWPKETLKSWDFDKNIEFPFDRIKSPDFKLYAEWSLKNYLNYIYTWSAVQKYIEENNLNPLFKLEDKLKKIWGKENAVRRITWNLKMKIGRV
jgi:ubiquinone/menaquinone biosynthesis C-methylase UbiE